MEVRKKKSQYTYCINKKLHLLKFNMASEDKSNDSMNENDINNPSTSQQNMCNETYDDGHSVASSAGSLQLTFLESKLDSEMTKMGRMVQDTVSSLSEIMNQKLTELDMKFNNLVADLVPNSHNQNVNSSVAQTNQDNSEAVAPAIACSSHSKGDNYQFRMKPQNFCGTTDFDEFLSQFEITCEINNWQYKEKSLYLANCLTGDARSVLSELDHEGRRDYNTLVEKLANRCGSVNRSEIFRAQLKSRVRNKGESIPELAQAVKKLVRQAYPGVNKDVIETLSIDIFIDALTDSEIRLRVRELGPRTLADAERTALRLESHKIADKQRSRLVGQLETDSRQGNNDQGESNKELEKLKNSINSLSDQVKNLRRQNQNKSENKFAYGNQQNNHNRVWDGRYSRQYNNNRPPGSQQKSYGPNRDNNPHRNRNSYQNQTAQNPRDGPYGFNNRNRQNTNRQSVDNRNRSAQSDNYQGNWNQSVWGATTRQY